MTLKEMAKQAIDIQTACNLSGVVHSFSNIIFELRKILDEKQGGMAGTETINTHPICQLFVDKMASLAHIQGITDRTMDTYNKAYDICQKLAKGEEIEDEEINS